MRRARICTPIAVSQYSECGVRLHGVVSTFDQRLPIGSAFLIPCRREESYVVGMGEEDR